MANQQAYNKIDAEVEKLKQKMAQAEKAKNLLSGDYVNQMDQRARTYRDFYKAPDSDSGSERSEHENSGESSEDEAARSIASWHHPRHQPRKIPNKREKYANQLKKAMTVKDGASTNYGTSTVSASAPGTPGLHTAG